MDDRPGKATPPDPILPEMGPEMDDLVSRAEQQARQLASLKDATSSFIRRDARLSQLREKTLLLRSRAKFEWNNCHDYRRFVRQSQEAYNDEAAMVMSPTSTEDSSVRLERLQSLHHQVMRDFEAQNEYAERANALQTELGELEYELQTRELSVKNAADMMKRILGDLVLPGDSGTATAVETEVPLSPSLQASEELNPLIENYFAKAGIVNNLMDQSYDLEVDFVDARADRDFKVEHDQALDISELDFEAQWGQKRNDLANQLLEARRIADTARDACLDNDLDPDKHRKRPRRDSDRSLSDSLPDDIARILPLDINVQVIGDGSYPHTRSSSNDGKGVFPVLTPETLPIFTSSRERQSEADVPAPLQDRVLDWMHDVRSDDVAFTMQTLDAQGLDALPRRSVSVSSHLNPPFEFQQHPAWAALERERQVPDSSRLAVADWSPDAERHRRRSSDSSVAAKLKTHNHMS